MVLKARRRKGGRVSAAPRLIAERSSDQDHAFFRDRPRRLVFGRQQHLVVCRTRGDHREAVLGLVDTDIDEHRPVDRNHLRDDAIDCGRLGTAHADTAEGIPGRVFDAPIEELELTVRAYNCLKRAGITKVGEILKRMEKGEDEMLAIRNFGKKSLDELVDKLHEKNYLTVPGVDLSAYIGDAYRPLTDGEETEE